MNTYYLIASLILVFLIVFLKVISKSYLRPELSKTKTPLYVKLSLQIFILTGFTIVFVVVLKKSNSIIPIDNQRQYLGFIWFAIIGIYVLMLFLLFYLPAKIVSLLFGRNTLGHHKNNLRKIEDEELQKKNRFKAGKSGEKTTYFQLNHLLPINSGKILSNINLKLDSKETKREKAVKIDHLLLSKHGIFCIETKNWKGKITVNEAGVYQNDLATESPIIQSQRHKSCIYDILSMHSDSLKDKYNFKVDMAKNHIQSFVVFTHPKCKLEIEDNFPKDIRVIKIKDILNAYESCQNKFSFSPELLEEVERLFVAHSFEDNVSLYRPLRKRIFDRILVA